ncbi:DUF2127 domain-containing protein [Oryzomicrobium sp.]|uniref:DUF2127 domain-containing protein n=1 Tax=Oryzomicrobium sp. TaxID=1911578 RepID=UPI0025EFA2F4|nr:DUF2127 domain-containing protein [Oryzomicrobium sp.]MCE1244310.1 DUF2127 domain-containing protein [Oryzomicrobium sp.]
MSSSDAALTPGAPQAAPRGLRAIAAMEALKGALVLIAGFGLLSLLHQDAQSVAEHLVHHLHLNPARRTPRIFLELASHVTDQRLWGLAALAALYASLRFLEAFGLWRGYAWAEWLGAVSGGIYVPLEVIELARHATALKFATLGFNLVVVVYLAWALWRRRQQPPLAESPR